MMKSMKQNKETGEEKKATTAIAQEGYASRSSVGTIVVIFWVAEGINGAL